MTKQMLLSLSNSPLRAHQVIDWLQQEGFGPTDIVTCLLVLEGTSYASRPPANDHPIMCGEVRDKTVTPHGETRLVNARKFSSKSLTNLLMTVGLSETMARYYEAGLRHGGILISVSTVNKSRFQRASKILELASSQTIAVLSPAYRRWFQMKGADV